MRFKITGQWKEGFKQDGMLYCAQRIEEMLMVFTSHLYKVPVYNTLLLANEYISVYSNVEEGLIDQTHLKNVLDEFISSFESDLIIKSRFSDDQISYFSGRLKGQSFIDNYRTINYLINCMKDYPDWCAQALRKIIDSPKDKKKIEKILRSYISMLIGIGYNPYYIYNVCRKTFCDDLVSSVDVFDGFLKKFSGLEKDFVVYFAVNKRVERFKSILEERLDFSFETDEYSEKFHYNRTEQLCAHITVSALDPNGAANMAYGIFDQFLEYSKFVGNRDWDWVDDRCLVKDSDGICSYPHIGVEKFFYSRDFDDKTLGESSDFIISNLLENAMQSDLYNIEKVINAHNSALASKDVNNAFLNLWSGLEIIGVDGYAGRTSKIKQILNNVVPVLKRNYLKRVFTEMHDYLKANLDTPKYYDVLNDIDEDGTESFKIACLIVLDKYEETRKKAYDYLENYPLIRSRISQLHEEVFSSGKKLLNEFIRYEKRINWHIQRLYRTRNSIIHSGEQCDNIISLVEHLHSYVDELVMELFYRIVNDPSLVTVSNVLLDAQVFVDCANKRFANTKSLSVEDINFLLQ